MLKLGKLTSSCESNLAKTKIDNLDSLEFKTNKSDVLTKITIMSYK